MAMEYFARILAHESKVKKYLGSNKDVLNELKQKKEDLFKSISNVFLKAKFYVASLVPSLFLKLFFMLCRLHLKQLRK